MGKLLLRKYFNYYLYSRGYLRLVLLHILKVEPQEVPLQLKPGKAPSLKGNNAYISISHPKDQFFLTCAPNPIGIDIEKK